MTTSSSNHPRVSYAATTTALIGALLAITVSTASAMPADNPPPTVTRPPAHADAHYVEHACFNEPNTWNAALAGPLPRCYLSIP